MPHHINRRVMQPRLLNRIDAHHPHGQGREHITGHHGPVMQYGQLAKHPATGTKSPATGYTGFPLLPALFNLSKQLEPGQRSRLGRNPTLVSPVDCIEVSHRLPALRFGEHDALSVTTGGTHILRLVGAKAAHTDIFQQKTGDILQIVYIIMINGNTHDNRKAVFF